MNACDGYIVTRVHEDEMIRCAEEHGLSIQKDRIFYAENNVQLAYETAMKSLKHSNVTAFFVQQII